MAAAKTTRKPAVKSAKANPGKVIEEPTTSLVQYLDQFRKAAAKKKGKQLENEKDAYLEAAKSDLTAAEFEQFEKAIAPDRVKKRLKAELREERKQNPRMSRAEYRQSKFQEAEEAGIWYPGHKHCKVCKQTDRKHYSGGTCTRCYTQARDKRLIEAGLKEDPAEKRRQREEAKAASEADKLKRAEERAAKAAERAEKAAERAKKAKEAVAKQKPAAKTQAKKAATPKAQAKKAS